MAAVTYATMRAKVIAMRRDPRYRGVQVLINAVDAVDDTTTLDALVTIDHRQDSKRPAALLAAEATAGAVAPNIGMKGPGRGWTLNTGLHDTYWPT